MPSDDGSADAVVIERTFDAPVDLVWQMWTDPDHFKAWYGPEGATIPVANMDVRVGGTRLVCMEMQSPNGPMRMWFAGEYLEVIENERLRYTESMSDENGNVSAPSGEGTSGAHPTTTEVRVELEDVGGKTRMLMTHAGVPGDSAGAAGWAMALDKLAAYLKVHGTDSGRRSKARGPGTTALSLRARFSGCLPLRDVRPSTSPWGVASSPWAEAGGRGPPRRASSRRAPHRPRRRARRRPCSPSGGR